MIITDHINKSVVGYTEGRNHGIYNDIVDYDVLMATSSGCYEGVRNREMDPFSKYSQRVRNRINLMKACVRQIKTHLDRETTVPEVIENLENLEYSLSFDWDLVSMVDPVPASQSIN
jgi:hypothetical protein